VGGDYLERGLGSCRWPETVPRQLW